jgi:hypothetical protein
MPSRPREHNVASLAVDAVTSLFHRCGWACDPVAADYGEDLLVQPAIDEVVDDCRIWIQVKGTQNIERFRRRDGHFAFPVDFDHALKWVRSADLVVVVLWDVPNGVGYWTTPLESINEWNWYLLRAKTARLRFSPQSVLDLEAAKWLGWRARVHHYSTLLNNALVNDDAHAAAVEVDGANRSGRRSRVPLIAIDFLQRLGVLTPQGIGDSVLAGYRNALPRMHVDPAEEGTTPELMAATLAVLGRLEEVAPGLGLPLYALEIFGRMATLMILEETDPGSVTSGRVLIPGLNAPEAG